MTDAQRLRLLFVVTGSGLGAMGGASLVVLLGSLWSVPSAVALVASIGGACLFGILWSSPDRFGVSSSRGSELTRSRRWALCSALPVFIVTMGWIVAMTTFSGISAFVLRRSTLLGVVGFMVLVHGAGAVIVTELARTTFPRTARWSDRRHFAGVGVLWMLFSATGALLLWRVRRELGWP
jgi:hypothetical protein